MDGVLLSIFEIIIFIKEILQGLRSGSEQHRRSSGKMEKRQSLDLRATYSCHKMVSLEDILQGSSARDYKIFQALWYV